MENGVKIGYARVSTDDQNLSLQEDALRRAGCQKLFSDHGVSGTEFSRPGLEQALKALRPHDTLVVWRLDRLGRSLAKLVELVNRLGERQVQFVSITENIDTRSPGGVLVFHMMAALAEFERALISERTRAGLAAARQRGKIPGRRHVLNQTQQAQALALLAGMPTAHVARRFNVHPRTLQRLLRDQTTPLPAPRTAICPQDAWLALANKSVHE